MTQVIDAHTHLGLERFIVRPISEEKRQRPAFRDRTENRVDQLLERMDANGVDRAVAFPYPLEEVDPVQANTYVLQAARRFPERLIPFALVGDDVEHWLKQGARGFKQHAILQSPERFDLTRAYRCMAEAQTPLIIHAISRETPPTVADQVRAILASAPTLQVIVAHMGRRTPNTSDQVEEALLALRDDSNVFFETSTVRDPAILSRAVDLIGEDRLLFGSDYPFNSYQDPDPLAVELGVIRRAGLDPRVTDKILGANLNRCLGLTARA